MSPQGRREHQQASSHTSHISGSFSATSQIQSCVFLPVAMGMRGAWNVAADRLVGLGSASAPRCVVYLLIWLNGALVDPAINSRRTQRSELLPQTLRLSGLGGGEGGVIHLLIMVSHASHWRQDNKNTDERRCRRTQALLLFLQVGPHLLDG